MCRARRPTASAPCRRTRSPPSGRPAKTAPAGAGVQGWKGFYTSCPWSAPVAACASLSDMHVRALRMRHLACLWCGITGRCTSPIRSQGDSCSSGLKAGERNTRGRIAATPTMPEPAPMDSGGGACLVDELQVAGHARERLVGRRWLPQEHGEVVRARRQPLRPPAQRCLIPARTHRIVVTLSFAHMHAKRPADHDGSVRAQTWRDYMCA